MYWGLQRLIAHFPVQCRSSNCLESMCLSQEFLTHTIPYVWVKISFWYICIGKLIALAHFSGTIVTWLTGVISQHYTFSRSDNSLPRLRLSSRISHFGRWPQLLRISNPRGEGVRWIALCCEFRWWNCESLACAKNSATCSLYVCRIKVGQFVVFRPVLIVSSFSSCQVPAAHSCWFQFTKCSLQTDSRDMVQCEV